MSKGRHVGRLGGFVSPSKKDQLFGVSSTGDSSTARYEERVPMFSVMWYPNRATIPAGWIPGDGQILSRALYVDAWAAINTGSVPLAADDAAWLSTPTERGKYSAGDGSTTFRMPDYNGKSAGTLGALFLRGDGYASTGVNGVVQGDAIRNIVGDFSVTENSANHISGTGPFYDKVSGATYNWLGTNPSLSLYTKTFDASRAVPTAAENRPVNVTGCWIVKLFGVAANPTAADAAQLATELGKTNSDVASLSATVAGLQTGKIDRSVVMGLDQLWTNMNGQRAFNTNYINSTTKAIQVKVSVAVSGVNNFTIYVNDVAYAVSNSGQYTPVVFGTTVPPGATYKISTSQASIGNATWLELR